MSNATQTHGHKVGEIVRLRREAQDPGDEQFTWRVVENRGNDRVLISPVDHPNHIKPTYTVLRSDLEPS